MNGQKGFNSFIFNNDEIIYQRIDTVSHFNFLTFIDQWQ